MNTYDIEVTDTFGGEANYCWVDRYTIEANSIRGAVNKLARIRGGGWRFDHGDMFSAHSSMNGHPVS